MRHPDGGPELAVRLDPDRAARAAGFDYFAIGVRDKCTLEALAEQAARHGDPSRR